METENHLLEPLFRSPFRNCWLPAVSFGRMCDLLFRLGMDILTFFVEFGSWESKGTRTKYHFIRHKKMDRWVPTKKGRITRDWKCVSSTMKIRSQHICTCWFLATRSTIHVGIRYMHIYILSIYYICIYIYLTRLIHPLMIYGPN